MRDPAGGPGIHRADGDGDGPLDIWAVVKPGNTKEKIAFFAARGGGGGGGRPGPLKSKSSWDIDGRAAKRRKKPPGPQRAKGRPDGRREEPPARRPADPADGGRPGRPPSVAEMVAFLERRAGALLASRAEAGPPRAGGPGPDAAEEGPGEAVRVLAMVARLESECLGRRGRREGPRPAPGGARGPRPKRPVSHDFLETRFRIQQLLEPQRYMTFLPHHIMVKIFGLLPTRSLVALKVTCAYFKFLIEHYNVRPADSRWVRDPRYREDPCKQCKKTYVHGDVSLCRWHPKPYCQALPYGPGYWMCCHRAQKGVPGCQLGLHDNRWVPACHSFNRPGPRRGRGPEDEG
ncbi:F-box only protein 34 [Ornithorhynchus anatinus]|uniref:F-box only protein 34 n=1 Tax=Ornithorhynchus anatinus TaxID=9258 RepID=UPI0010A79BCD|nr:F-box only protein 34 [Ornithorhynchus anatinus]